MEDGAAASPCVGEHSSTFGWSFRWDRVASESFFLAECLKAQIEARYCCSLSFAAVR